MTTILVKIIAELQRQADEAGSNIYLDLDIPADAIIDGRVDLVALAQALEDPGA